MKNNKGFTIIELAVSFVLVATISLTLLQLVLSLKEVYLSGEVKTTLLNKQGIMTKYIYEDLNNKDVRSITSCGLSCLKFTYSDHSSKNLIIDSGNKTMTYGDYTMKLTSDSFFGDLTIDKYESSDSTTSNEDSIFKLNIPIYSKLIDNEDFGFHIIKTYNHNYLSINTTIDINDEKAKITLSGIDCKLKMLFDSDDSTKLLGIFANIYHQTTEDITQDISGNNFLRYSNETTHGFSSLTSLEAFRMKINADQIITKETEKLQKNNPNVDLTNNIKILTEDYKNGYFSLLLNYNDVSLNSGNYLWWYQTSNFAKKEPLKNFSISYSDYLTAPNGLVYNNNENDTYWANILGEQTNLGVKTGGQIIDFSSPPKPATSVDLYVEAREYICKYGLNTITYNGQDIRNLTLVDGTRFCPLNETNEALEE